MFIYDYFVIVFIIASLMWFVGSVIALYNKSFYTILYLLGSIAVGVYLILIWIFVQRPPLKTLGETRLWYALFLSLIGLLIQIRWQYKWVLIYTTIMSSLFLFINFVTGHSIFDKDLAPALRSIWFIPHVVVYMIAYAFLGAVTCLALYGIYKSFRSQSMGTHQLLTVINNYVKIGFGFLTFGLLFGAIWAKQSWGHYWSWDPKETWALLTWMFYLIYLHLNFKPKISDNFKLSLLITAFAILLFCWFGLNYISVNSIHTYGS